MKSINMMWNTDLVASTLTISLTNKLFIYKNIFSIFATI